MTTIISKKINLPGAEINYIPNFFTHEDANFFFNNLKEHTPWRHDKITVFGKIYDQPRLTAFYANNNKAYKYSNIVMQPLVFDKEVQKIKQLVDAYCKEHFTSCLLNLYRDGSDSNGWHADDEPELGENPIIASISLGASRWFHLKHKKDSSLKSKILLEHGSLLVMRGETQHNWLHQIPKTKKIISPRINLTFRIIK